MSQIPKEFVEMFDLYDHLPQALTVTVRECDLGCISKAQLWVRVEDVLTDVLATWHEVSPIHQIRLTSSTQVLVFQIYRADSWMGFLPLYSQATEGDSGTSPPHNYRGKVDH